MNFEEFFKAMSGGNQEPIDEEEINLVVCAPQRGCSCTAAGLEFLKRYGIEPEISINKDEPEEGGIQGMFVAGSPDELFKKIQEVVNHRGDGYSGDGPPPGKMLLTFKIPDEMDLGTRREFNLMFQRRTGFVGQQPCSCCFHTGHHNKTKACEKCFTALTACPYCLRTGMYKKIVCPLCHNYPELVERVDKMWEEEVEKLKRR